MNINKRKDSVAKYHLNYEGGKSYNLSALMTLYTVGTSCFFGEPQYYNQKGCSPAVHKPAWALDATQLEHLTKTLNLIDPAMAKWRGLSVTPIVEKAIDDALAVDPLWVLDFATYLRNVENIRTLPQVIFARAARLPAGEKPLRLTQFAPYVMSRLDEPTVAMAYYLEKYGKKKMSIQFKKSMKIVLENANAFSLSKYRQDDKIVRLRDVVSLSHASTPAIGKLMQDELRQTGNTWEAKISKEGSNKQSWEESIDLMGHMALLRNLRNLLENNVNPDLFCTKLIDGVKGGKQFPFRYHSAYQEVEKIGGTAKAKVLDALEKCVDISVDNLPKLKGRTLILIDNSGSAQGCTLSAKSKVRIADAGNLLGILIAKCSDDGVVGVFGDNLKCIPVGKGGSTLKMLKHINDVGNAIGMATETGLFDALQGMTLSGEKYDRVVILSDMQAGHGHLYGRDSSKYPKFPGGMMDVPTLINQYRKVVNKDVNVFSVQIAGQVDNVMPEFYHKTWLLAGWGENVIKFAHNVENLNTSVIQQVRNAAKAIRIPKSKTS